VQNEFLSLVRPLAFSCSLAFFHPSHPPLTQTVGRQSCESIKIKVCVKPIVEISGGKEQILG
jgi:hypothetical protein